MPMAASLGLLNAYGTSSEEEEEDAGREGEVATRVGAEQGASEADRGKGAHETPREGDEGGARRSEERQGQAGSSAQARGNHEARPAGDGEGGAFGPCDPAVQAKVTKFLQLKRLQVCLEHRPGWVGRQL